MSKYLSLLLISLALFTSCEKVLLEPDLGSKDPLTNFDYLWEEVDKKYSYFELKNIDWEAIKNNYRPMISSNSSEEELFNVLAEMLNQLRDDHTNLISPFNVSSYNVAYTGEENYRRRTIVENYIPDIWSSSGFSHGFLANEEIGYIRYSSFISNFRNEELSLILKRYQNTKGLIIDLRSNGGGNVFNVPKLLSRFVDSKTLIGFSINRNGPEHDDFGEREPFYITPYDGRKYANPIMVLIDRGSYSATTFFALATKAFPNIKLIGDTTGGGGGLPNGGQMPNGWTYRFSISQLLDLDGNNYAEDGVPADIEAAFDWSDFTKDEILERAILELQ